jgi:ATP-dependent helicase YprA (DUF1998 family)
MDPLVLAEEIKKSYAINLIGTDPEAMKKLLARFDDPAIPLKEKLGNLVKMRGPYLQALPIPQWSKSELSDFARTMRGKFVPNGLEPEIIETFTELGFQRLYEFQEQAVQAVLDDQHTLVVAGTGRGKTESWLFPLFHYIIARKRDKIQDDTPKQGTKALLIYPTKALAQDQLKRLLNYLFRLNQKLEPTAQISVGIFDGDTPRRNDVDAKNYLFQAFQYFRCPIYNADQAICQSCGQHLIVPDQEYISAPYSLALPRPECRPLAPLNFVKLTRDDITDTMPDIVLTNPDMLNLRLLNINGEPERRFLIEQPKFIVLDEVHIYTELFGSFTSFIVKRLRQERTLLRRHSVNSDAGDRLRFIAASATVANEQDLFTRLCNLASSEVRVVRERTFALEAQVSAEPPVLFTQAQFDEAGLIEALRQFGQGQPPSPAYVPLLDLFDLNQATLPPADRGEDSLLEAVAEWIYGRLTNPGIDHPGLNILRELHRTLTDQPMTPAEFHAHLETRFPQTDKTALANLGHNFITVAVFSGLLESRAHLFAWPIDGYYTCLDCGRVYDTMQALCHHCNGHAIHKIALCNECGEEAVESWYCPYCRQLYPLNATVEGENVYYRGRPCLCTGEERPTLRVIWKPYYRCDQCNEIARLSPADLDGQVRPACPHQCDGRLRPLVTLPWTCKAGHPHFVDPPPKNCHCGSRIFVLAGLFDIDTGERCDTCKGDFLEGMPHPVDHSRSPGGDYREYKLLDHHWRIRRPIDFHDSVPCHHLRSRYRKMGGGARYDTLMRSPANAAVTAAQYALRYLVGHPADNELRQKLREAKLLSFSDSYSDMEQLGQDFDDPERNTFIDQAIVTLLGEGECTLQDLTENVMQMLRRYGQLLQGDSAQQKRGVNWIEHFEGKRGVWDEVERRFLSGNYSFQSSYSPWLVREAIADVHLVTRVADDERPIVAELASFNRVKRETLMQRLQDQVPNYAQVLERLETRGVIQASRFGRVEVLYLNPAHLICTLVDEAHPIPCDKVRGYLRGFSTLEVETDRRTALGRFSESYRQRAHLDHPHFSRVAYRLAYARPMLLRSQVYKGNIPKEMRREIEFEFKEGSEIHFLSSGPAMEVGIDIGDLDLLLLYGTPPNINAYLQRIGRAGRRSKQSLILSVSKRNPIDFYYYRRPLDLIRSAPQPVPLNEHNEEVMKVSLTWALLDFIAVNFWVPWQKLESPDGVSYTDGQNFLALLTDSSEPSGDIYPLLWLIYVAKTIDIDDGHPLETLSIIIKDRRDQARAYLADLLAYRLCSRCGAYIHDESAQTCPLDNCSGQPFRQADRYSQLIDTVMDEFPKHVVDFLVEFRNELWTRRKRTNREVEDLQDDLMRQRRMPQEQKRELNTQVRRLTDKVRAIDDLLQRLERMSFADAQKYSTESRYAYTIRSAEESVEVIEYGEHNGKIQARLAASRGMGMALKEHHPYAVILAGRQKVFTRAAHFDNYRTEQLKERLTEANILDEPFVCAACGRTYQIANAPVCRCGAPLQRMALKVLRSAEVQPTRLRLGEDPEDRDRHLYPRNVFRLSGSEAEVKRTYANLNSQVVAFTPSRCLTLVDDHNRPIGMLDFGQIEVVTFADTCTVIYENGFRQPWPQVFEICGEEDCHGVIVQSREQKFCALDPVRHQRSPRQVVRLGHLFATEGLRLRLPDDPIAVTHALAHGLRMGLEKVGGVLVRNVHELMEQNTLYIYDSIPGGSGVTGLLVQPQGETYSNFQVALETMQIVMDQCHCDDGCPHCLYQYGCTTWNAPASLTRHGLRSLLMSGLHLRSITTPLVDGANTASLLAWSPEEDHLRQKVWVTIGHLEVALRHLVKNRYDAAHGETWPEYFFPEEKLLKLKATQAREEKKFVSGHHLLDYTYLQDLLELIHQQWDLFQNPFGDDKKAKKRLTEKMQIVMKVRNPLAHNRLVPTEELQQAEANCQELSELLRLR